MRTKVTTKFTAIQEIPIKQVKLEKMSMIGLKKFKTEALVRSF